ncbi:hypothetical protein [Gilvibacter sp.]|jgi:hypothetical protein|uniref:hypothetical protein n=1 Tax=Gilvibacter sp. TaxID=2729997 RepID=UPI003B519BE3
MIDNSQIDQDLQCKMLYENDFSELFKIAPELENEKYLYSKLKSFITIDKDYYKNYLKSIDLINIKLNSFHKSADGIYLVKTKSGYEMFQRERGTTSQHSKYENEDDVLEIYVNLLNGSLCRDNE